MFITILKDKMANGKTYCGFKIEEHGMKGHPPVIETWFEDREKFEKNLLHYIGQYIGRTNKVKKD